MDKHEIEKLRGLDIEAVGRRLGLDIRHHRALCCFHDDHTPSLHFDVKRNKAKCWSCGKSGISTVDLTMQVLGLTFIEACRWLANENNIILTEHKPKAAPAAEEPQRVDIAHLSRLVGTPGLNAEARRFLFDERHIHPAVVRWLGLTSISTPVPMSGALRGSWFNAPSLIIPYKGVDGELLNVQARYLGKEKKQRFQFPKGGRCHIFNLPVLKMLRQGEDLQICEGPTDCMAALSSGVKAIAIPSATLLNHDDMRLMAEHLPPESKLIIYPDKDDAGERLYDNLLRVATDIRRCLVRRDLPEGCKDFGDYWKQKFI